MTIRAIRMALPAAVLAFAGCGWLPDAYTGCNEAQPYQAAEQREQLRVPAGADLPDTRNALKVPEVNSPELPRDPSSCLEHPPSFGDGSLASATAGSAPAAAGGGGEAEPTLERDLAMESGSPWQFRLGGGYQPTTDVDFDGGSTVEFNSSTNLLAGFSYALSRQFEIGANLSYDDRDFDASLAGDEPGEFFSARGSVETAGVMFDLSYYFLTGRVRPFITTGVGWSFVETNIPTAPPQVGCWWNPWYGYVCSGFQETKDVDGLAYQAAAGVNFRINQSLSLSGSYRANWVEYPKADGTPMFDAIQMILHWAF